MSNIGVSSGWPAIRVSRADASFTPASVAIAMSAEVPPMSKVTRRRRPTSAPAQLAPSTPAAGPDSMRVTGRSAASATLATPPLERMTRISAATPSRRSAASRRSRYAPVPGPTNAFMAAVVKRSNSRNCGVMSAEVQTKQSGSSSRRISAARSSCAGSR